MNIIFLTLLDFNSFSEHNIYCDVLRELKKNGHEVYCVSPVERRTGIETHMKEDGHLLKLKIGNTQKTNMIEKGISTLMLESQYVKGIEKYFAGIKFDLVLYTTPPITLFKAVRYLKKRDNAKTYLMLKDIFPQNALDLRILKTSGLKGILYRFFKRKEKKLYDISDYIGCMSLANVDFVIKNNPNVDPAKVELCPNCIEVRDFDFSEQELLAIRDKYGIPRDRKVFVYGGNLGRPQGIEFIIECLKSQENNEKAFFLIVGDGTEYGKLEEYFNQTPANNMKLMKRLPKEDFDAMVAACDVGLLFLDYRFTIPNFPSRLLSYLQSKICIISCTDPNTDVGDIIEANGFGWKCLSNDVVSFGKAVDEAIRADTKSLGENGYKYLLKEYSAEKGCKIIMNRLV